MYSPAGPYYAPDEGYDGSEAELAYDGFQAGAWPHPGYSPAYHPQAAGYGYYPTSGGYYPAPPPGFAGYAAPYPSYAYSGYGPQTMGYSTAAYSSSSSWPPPPPGQPSSSSAQQQPSGSSSSSSRRQSTGSAASPPPAPGGTKRPQKPGAGKAAPGSQQPRPRAAVEAAASDNAVPVEPRAEDDSATTHAAVGTEQPEAAIEDAAVEAAAERLQRAAVLSDDGDLAAADAAVPATPAPVAEPAAAPSAPASSEAAPAAASPAVEERRECAICLDDEPAAIGVPCGHVTMCAPCSIQYLAKHKDCPACAGQLDSLFIPGRGLVKPNAWTAR